MNKLRRMCLAELIDTCRQQTVNYLRTKEFGDDSYCLELFRRAVQDGDERAWAFIYTFYSTEEFFGKHYVLKWVRSWMHGRHGPAIRATYTEGEMVQEVWLRFMRSEAAKNFQFDSMRHLMAFLRRLINNFAMDVARRRLPQIMDVYTPEDGDSPLDLLRLMPDDAEPLDRLMSSQEAMDHLLRELQGDVIIDNKEWLVFQGYYLDELPPRKLYQDYPDDFSPGEVETIRTRLARRLRKAPFLLERFIQVCVLKEDERLSTTFEQVFILREPDCRTVERFPTLFRDENDLMAAKVQVVRALHNRPSLLQLLNMDL
ncbi:MAG: hypothetical protein U9R25_04670 [Chloroflexota bacterium]|nr:hypothetical protein [Chloroflexota bacterium]